MTTPDQPAVSSTAKSVGSAAAWRSPSAKHQRRLELMVLIGCGFLIVAGTGWAVLYALRDLWVAVSMELSLVITGVAGIVMVRHQRVHVAGLMVLAVLFFILCGICLWLDVPSANAPRSSHTLMPALGACAFLLLRGHYPWLRHGVTVSFFVAYYFLDSTSFDQLRPEHGLCVA